MTSFLAKLMHATAIGGQVFAAYGGIIPVKYQGPIAIGLGALQFTIGQIQQTHNPDGTPAELPFRPPQVPPSFGSK